MRRNEELVGIRKEMAKFRSETKQRLDAIEHELNKHLSLNYARTIVDYMARTTGEFVKSLKCEENRQTEQMCKEETIAAQRKYLDALKVGNLGESSKALAEIIGIVKHVRGTMIAEEKECATCYQRQLEIFEANKSLLDDLYALNLSPMQDLEKLEIADNINPSEINEEILKPISHEIRVKIMLSLFKGDNRFGNLVKSTGLSGGHLLFHVNKLIQHGFVHKYSSKDYGLTKKGIKTMLLMAQLYMEK